MKVVGLTGGIGSGKTTVAGFFKELGIPIYIADEEAKKLLHSSKSLKSAIITLFGEQAYNKGQLDRKYIATQVFLDKEKLESLNSLVHPEVNKDFEEWKVEQKAPYVIYEAAILFEKGGYKKCDYVVLVTANLQDRIERLQKRDLSTIEEIEARMAHQWSDDRKKTYSEFIIENNSLSYTRDQVLKVHQFLLTRT